MCGEPEMKARGRHDAYFELLLKIRRQQPTEFDALDASLKIEVLQYGCRTKQKDLIDANGKSKNRIA
jgi:hypothetical protein